MFSKNDARDIAVFVLIGLVGAFTMFVGYHHATQSTTQSFQQEAVSEGKAYWCIEDHEKVFSWDECE